MTDPALTSDSEEEDDDSIGGSAGEDEERRQEYRLAKKKRLFNFARVAPDRRWLQDFLLSDTESDESDISDEDELLDVAPIKVRGRHRSSMTKTPKIMTVRR